ncbi:MAG: hypothetical protein MUF78_08465 [Candidatus Edwardsbacteria bacterium]|jgi:hypothetical protein|nr:hypothetical protein [Candidatus Edwardsbacteria bacterium]
MERIDRRAACSLLALLALIASCTRDPSPGTNLASVTIRQAAAETIDYSSYNLEYNFAVPMGKTIHFYLSPNTVDKNLLKTVEATELSKPYFRLLRTTAKSVMTIDNQWIKKNEIRPYYSKGSFYDIGADPEELNKYYPSKGIVLKTGINVYWDSSLQVSRRKLEPRDTFVILRRRKEGYPVPSLTGRNPDCFEVFQVYQDKNGSIDTGWIQAENVIKIDQVDKGHPEIISGVIGIRYSEPAGGYGPLQHTWVQFDTVTIALGECYAYWLSTSNTFFMANYYHEGNNTHTAILNSSGKILFASDIWYTSPAWLATKSYVRGMWDDDGVYVIDISMGTCESFFKCPDQYINRPPDYGSGDGYYAYPAPVIDATMKTVTIRFDRHREDPEMHGVDYGSYLLATTDLTGKLIKIEEKTDRQR